MVSKFDDQKAYAEQHQVFFDDGREIELLHYVYSRPNIEQIRGSPSAVLGAIDEFGRQCKYLMNVGEDKGAIVAKLIADTRPSTMVELGGYVGYSAIVFGDALRKAGGKRYICLERNPEFGAVAASLIELAGLADLVKVVIGGSSTSLQRLHKQGDLKQIDCLFLDHYKPAYLTDLKLCERLGLVGPGAVLAADNVIKPGNPPYLEYVRSSVEDKIQASRAPASSNGFDERTSKQYEKREGAEQLDENAEGDPNLIYESQLIHSFEPTGVPDGIEITRCVGRQP